MCYNSTGVRFALQEFEFVGVSLCFQLLLGVFLLFRLCRKDLSSFQWFLLFLFSFLSPVSFLLLIYFSSFLIKKKKKNYITSNSSLTIYFWPKNCEIFKEFLKFSNFLVLETISEQCFDLYGKHPIWMNIISKGNMLWFTKL